MNFESTNWDELFEGMTDKQLRWVQSSLNMASAKRAEYMENHANGMTLLRHNHEQRKKSAPAATVNGFQPLPGA